MTSPALKITAGVAGGYLLGRRRKMRLAVGLGAYLLGKKITTSPTALLGTAFKSLQELPEFAELGEAVRGELATAGRGAAGGMLSQRLESLSDALADRSRALEGGQGGESDESESDAPDRGSRGKGKSRGRARRDDGDRDDAGRDEAPPDEYDEADREPDRDEVDDRERDDDPERDDDRERDDDEPQRDRGEPDEYDDENAEAYPDEIDVRDAPRDEEPDGGSRRSTSRRRREPAHR